MTLAKNCINLNLKTGICYIKEKVKLKYILIKFEITESRFRVDDYCNSFQGRMNTNYDAFKTETSISIKGHVKLIKWCYLYNKKINKIDKMNLKY